MQTRKKDRGIHIMLCLFNSLSIIYKLFDTKGISAYIPIIIGIYQTWDICTLFRNNISWITSPIVIFLFWTKIKKRSYIINQIIVHKIKWSQLFFQNIFIDFASYSLPRNKYPVINRKIGTPRRPKVKHINGKTLLS